MRNRTIRFGLCLVALVATVSAAQAQTGLLINPGTLTSTGLTGDDNVVTRTLPTTGTFTFYGTNHTTVDVATNGYLNFVGESSFVNSALPSNVARIMPLWDDMITTATAPATNILDNQGDLTHPYYAITWQNIANFSNSAARYTFQVVWFNGAATIGGFNFQAGDIAFDYAQLTNFFKTADGSPGATVGVDRGNGTTFAPLPGTTDGTIADTTLLPADDNRFVLFRFNPATGNFSGSIQTTSSVPEPATCALTACGLALAFAGYRRRTRRRRAQKKVATKTMTPPAKA